MVERVRAHGFGIAVDDLGADWRSLALLPFLRPDGVKIDLGVVQGPLTDEMRSIAAAVRAYADESGAQVLAEGIETDEHERRAAEQAAPAVVLGAFQRAEHFRHHATHERFARLARGEAFVGAFGVGMADEPAPGVRGAALRANERLACEWDIIVVGPHVAEALIARDLGDAGPDSERRLEYVHATDRALIVRAARALMLSIVPSQAGAAAGDRRPA
jgi:DICT domain-containing protein